MSKRFPNSIIQLVRETEHHKRCRLNHIERCAKNRKRAFFTLNFVKECNRRLAANMRLAAAIGKEINPDLVLFDEIAYFKRYEAAFNDWKESKAS